MWGRAIPCSAHWHQSTTTSREQEGKVNDRRIREKRKLCRGQRKVNRVKGLEFRATAAPHLARLSTHLG